MRLLLIAAVLPGLFIMYYVYKKDWVEKEPIGLIIKLLVFGAIAVVPAVLLELLGSVIVYGGIDEPSFVTRTQVFLDNFVVVAVSEELCKFLFLKKLTWKHPAFDYRFDAIVYSVSVSMGFAILENIMYVFEHGLSIALTRALISIPGHACFAVTMGVFYGQAKLNERLERRSPMKTDLFMAVLLPVLMHGFFDFCLSIDSGLYTALFYVFIIVADIICLRLIKNFSKKDYSI
ncbi:MAG: PrsW family intramembrane metalloprotease [Lachnospiraceae bacterium]|nr:PrsW family intramembrane metalloprotease [Lachnospiraceae bacterium]